VKLKRTLNELVLHNDGETHNRERLNDTILEQVKCFGGWIIAVKYMHACFTSIQSTCERDSKSH
jgi:hypothetical protein